MWTFCWRPVVLCKETWQLRARAELLSLELPTVYAEAMEVCAQMSAVAAEANIVSTLVSPKLNSSEKRHRLDSCLKKIKQQSQAYKVEVKPLMYAPLLEEATQWLLEC
eukprot:2406433-Amphidinium_carterae.1